jgi:serine/threonine protein kinase
MLTYAFCKVTNHKGRGYSTEVDIWSSGIVLYILLCGFTPHLDDGTSDGGAWDDYGPRPDASSDVGIDESIFDPIYTQGGSEASVAEQSQTSGGSRRRANADPDSDGSQRSSSTRARDIGGSGRSIVSRSSEPKHTTLVDFPSPW